MSIVKHLLLLFIFLTALIPFSYAQQKYDFVVAQDGSGDYKTIQEAVTACRDFWDRKFIFIKNGMYKEKLLVPAWKTKISLIGESVDSTIIEYDDYSGKGDLNTFTSYTVKVEGDDFYAENITFKNSAGPVGQALALYVSGDRCVFRNCRLIGNQDTLYATGEHSRQYYANCYIEGTTDFIFGSATAVFDHCTIRSLKNSYITAASTTTRQPYGFVFLDCKLTAAPDADQVYLGRPWRDHGAVAFIRTDMGDQIRPEGWHNWDQPQREKTARYAEYGSKGPGANPDKRVKWAHQLTAKQAKEYTVNHMLAGADNWKPEDF